MNEPRRACRAALVRLLSIGVVAGACAAAALAEPPAAVIDTQSIVRSLAAPPAPTTRGLMVAPRIGGGAGGGGGGVRKITLDIRFGNDSDHLTPAAHTQLAQLGAALDSPELAHTRFLIAGHTSASGAAAHNQRLSASRARAVRAYLIEHFKIAPERLEATGFGASHPLPDFPPNALQQRRVEVSTLPPGS